MVVIEVTLNEWVDTVLKVFVLQFSFLKRACWNVTDVVELVDAATVMNVSRVTITSATAGTALFQREETFSSWPSASLWIVGENITQIFLELIISI